MAALRDAEGETAKAEKILRSVLKVCGCVDMSMCGCFLKVCARVDEWMCLGGGWMCGCVLKVCGCVDVCMLLEGG